MDETPDEYNVKLPHYWFQCPGYWKNFGLSLPISPTDYDILNNSLREYHGSLSKDTDNSGQYTLTFKSESDFLVFKLKWS